MGNKVPKCCAAGEGIVRVMTAEGDVEEFECPISAGEVLDRHPDHQLLDTTGLDNNMSGRNPVLANNKVTFMDSTMILQPGRLYVLYADSSASVELEKSTPIHQQLPVPSESEVAPSRFDPTITYTYSSDSKKVPLDHRPSFASQGPNEDEFDEFPTVTWRRRRSSMSIASDILHTFQVKEEASPVDDVPGVPEPKEEKSKCHGWSPSLSSIPESPANSLRAAEAAPASTKQISKTSPRNSSDLNKLLKQAILHKHPRSFWR